MYWVPKQTIHAKWSKHKRRSHWFCYSMILFILSEHVWLMLKVYVYPIHSKPAIYHWNSMKQMGIICSVVHKLTVFKTLGLNYSAYSYSVQYWLHSLQFTFRHQLTVRLILVVTNSCTQECSAIFFTQKRTRQQYVYNNVQNLFCYDIFIGNYQWSHFTTDVNFFDINLFKN